MKMLLSKKFHTPPFFINEEDPLMGFSQTIDWGLAMTGIENIHKMGLDGDGVKVAVLDTRVDISHPDLQGAVKDSFNAINDTSKTSGHGTAVAGVIAAQNNNDGVLGVAPGAHIFAVKMLHENGSGTSKGLVKALDYIEDLDIDIINLSLGAPAMPKYVAKRMKRMEEEGRIFICAAGNTGKPNNVMFPAKLDCTIAVGAINRSREASAFSSRGPQVNIAAPGEKILTTWASGGYKVISGTSFAAPFVAGVAALLKQKIPHLNREMLMDIIKASALDIDTPGRDSRTGHGLINPEGMLDMKKDPNAQNKVLESLIALGKEMILQGHFTKQELLNRL